MENEITTNVENAKAFENHESTVLVVEHSTKQNFGSIGSWAKFLGICGYIMTGLMVCFGLAFIFLGSKVFSVMNAYQGASIGAAAAGFPIFLGVFMGFIFIVSAIIYFFLAHFCYRAGKGYSDAIRNGDQTAFDYATGKLKNLFIFYGVLTIIGLVLTAFYLIFVLTFAGIALSGF